MSIRLSAIAIFSFLSVAAEAATVTVSDGDTIKVDGVKIRLIGYDTPETNKALCKDGDAYRERRLGFRASNYLAKLLREQPYEIRWHHRKDRYGRELAQLFVGGKDIAGIMIGHGLAVKYECPNYRCPRRIDWCKKLTGKAGASR